MAKPPVKAAAKTALAERVQPAQLDLPAPLQAYLQNTLGQIDALSGDPDALWMASERGLQMEAAGKILAGRAFIALRAALPSGDFASGLAQRNIARSSAYAAIEAFELFAALPELRVVQALGQLGVTKAQALKDWTTEEHTAFADGEEVRGLTLSGAAEMSSRDLQQQQRDWQLENDDRVAELERKNAQLQTQLETAQNRNKLLARQGAALQTEEDLPHFALVVRQEAMALTEQMGFCLDNLEAIANEHLLQEVKHPEAAKWQPVAASTYWHALAAVQARAQVLLLRISGTFEEAVGAIDLDVQLSPAEIKRHIEGRDLLLAQHQSKAKARDDKRENERPGKRGAKRKG